MKFPEQSNSGMLAEPELSDFGICAPLSLQSEGEPGKHTVFSTQSENDS